MFDCVNQVVVEIVRVLCICLYRRRMSPIGFQSHHSSTGQDCHRRSTAPDSSGYSAHDDHRLQLCVVVINGRLTGEQNSSCQEHRKAPLRPWDWSDHVWSRLHMNFAGPFMGKQVFVLVDSDSKWQEVHPATSKSTKAAVDKLRQIFATHGLPNALVSDNGAAFTSKEFADFLIRNGICHITSSPHHPSTNGLAERAIQTFKQAMRKSSGFLENTLQSYCFPIVLPPLYYRSSTI